MSRPAPTSSRPARRAARLRGALHLTPARALAGLGLAGAVTAAIIWSRGATPAAASAPAAPVTLVAPGLVEAHGDRVELAFETGGRISELTVDEGAPVTAGQIVARLDDRVARARVDGAEAGVAAAAARLDLARRGSRSDEIRAAAAEADAARATADERALARARAEALARANPDAIPDAELDSVRGQAETSAAAARAAAARATLVRRGTRAELIAEARAALDAARAELAEARAHLDDHVLRSPRDGVVVRRLHEVGEHVSTMPPTIVLIVADTAHLELRVEVDEVDVGRVAIGQAAWATALAYGDHRFEGRVTRVLGELGRKTQRLDDPRARIDTRVLEVVVALDRPADLPLGLRMDVHLEPLATAAVPEPQP